MANLKPWYKVVTPREDLREGKPLDASEFAVHLDQVRDGRAHEDYQNPERFFEKTFLTKNLLQFSSEVVRRLSGEKTEASAIFNMSTQFGGGKTHALTLLYHLAANAAEAKKYQGVDRIFSAAGIKKLPEVATAVFVGTEFDSIQGRGGGDGTPMRKTPWGEIAFQLSGENGFKVIAEHEKQLTAPSAEVIRKFLPKDKPVLILIDELLNYISRSRKMGLANQLYHFLQNLSEESRGRSGMVLVVSIPASELEMTVEDQGDFSRFKKLLDRLGKPVVMSAETETSEIIRRRLFEWDSHAVGQSGKLLLNKDAIATCQAYADWIGEHRQQIPNWFTDHAKEAFEATYPFHPMVLSVFERKWQELPRFQQTRGILRLLALWVSHAYQSGFKGAMNEPLIGLGTAPLEDSLFRSAIFEQLNEMRLEGAVTTDIAGKKESHSVLLDNEAEQTLKKAQIHKKVATVIFFESNGGQARNHATVPEIRLSAADPTVDIGNIETALEALCDACYYLNVEKNQYRFSLKENLNKRFSDRRANIKDEDIDRLVREEIQKVFPPTEGIERIFFPEKSNQIPDRPVTTFVVMGPDRSVQDDAEIQGHIDSLVREYGTSSRTFKSALIFIVPESSALMKDEARKFLAWQDIDSEKLNFDEAQKRQLSENIKKAARDLRESVWRSYKNVILLNKDNRLKTVDLGLVTSSSAETFCKHIITTLRQMGEIEKQIGARFLLRNWPPVFVEWSTQSVRDAFYASPQFPRLLQANTIREAIARGVTDGLIAYVGKRESGGYDPFFYKDLLEESDVEISEDVFIIKSEEAEKHIRPPELSSISINPQSAVLEPNKGQSFTIKSRDQFGNEFPLKEIQWSSPGGETSKDGVYTAGAREGNFLITVRSGKVSAQASVTISKQPKAAPAPVTTHGGRCLVWSGEISPLKWMQFYNKIVSKFVRNGAVKLNVRLEAAPQAGASDQEVSETKAALRELGMDEDVNVE